MKHIVQLSGGKDSTAMLLMMLERGMPVDEILFCDTGIEFPAMYEHLNRVEQYTGRKITRLKAKHDFYWWFWCNQKVKGKTAGQFGMSWPGFKSRWCTKRLKTQVSSNYLQSAGEYIQYIGIAADEPKRHRNIPDNVRHPLYDWGITEQQALQYCYDHGFDWDGLYEHFDRVSCWLCPLQGIKELRTLRKLFPELWSKLRVMDALTYFKYRDDYSIEQLERRFALEDAQGCLFEVDEVVKNENSM